MSQQPITRPPGWYADPIADGAQRWWDGRHWSALGPMGNALPTPEPVPGDRRVAGLTVWHWLILGFCAALAVTLIALAEDAGTLGGFVLFALLGALWLSPGIIASKRGHRNAGGIWVVTLLLGWTIVGWVVALAMALSDPGPRR